MLAVTQTLIQELGLIAKALGLLSEATVSDRARGALMFSVETIGHIEQRIIDLEFMIQSKNIELESYQAEVARLRDMTVTDIQGIGNPFGGSRSTVA